MTDNRTSIVKLLLRLSESIDYNDTEFKRKMYNIYLSRLKFMITGINSQDEEVLRAYDIIKLIEFKNKLPENYYSIKSRYQKTLKHVYIAIKMIYDNCDLTLKQIAGIFERDHASILHAIRVVDNLIDTNKVYKENYFKLLQTNDLNYKRYERQRL